MNSFIQSPRGQTDRQGVQEEFVVSIPHHLTRGDRLALFNDNFSVILVKHNMIPVLSIELVCDVFNKSNIAFSSNLTTAKKFHNINCINDINESIKYIINYFNYINNCIDFIDNWSGMVWKEKNC